MTDDTFNSGWLPGHVLALIIIAAPILALTLFFIDRDITNSLEVGYGLTAQEMVRDGHWIVPTQNGLPRIYKPPVPFWIGAATCKILGSETAPMWMLRGASAVIALLTAFLLYALGCSLFNRRAGLWSGLVWGTSMVAVYEMRYARHDIYLVCFVVLAMLGAWRVLRKQSFGWMLLVLGLLLAFQAKGPVSWGFTVLPFLIYVVAYERERWRVLPFVGLVMLVVAFSLYPWAQTMQRAVPIDLGPVYFHETVGRFQSEQVKGYSPFFYLQYLGYVFPWTMLLIPALAWPGRRLSSARERGRAFAWLWLICGLIFLSLAREKRTRYGVPLIAPGALLVGHLMATYIQAAPVATVGRSRLAWAHSLALLVAGAATPVVLIAKDMLRAPIAIAAGTMLVALALVVRHHIVRGRYLPMAAWTVVYAVALMATFLGAQATAPSYQEPLRVKAVAIAEAVGDRPVFAWTRAKPPYQLVYYSGIVAPQITHPLMLAINHPQLPYDQIMERRLDEDQRVELEHWALEKHLKSLEEDEVFVLCDTERLEALVDTASMYGYRADRVMDVTTMRPRYNKPRPSRELVKLTRTGHP